MKLIDTAYYKKKKPSELNIWANVISPEWLGSRFGSNALTYASKTAQVRKNLDELVAKYKK